MPDPTKPGMLCPVCRVDLVMSDRQGVEIDYCPTCRGVWLDRGELDKIIDRSAAHESPPPPPSQPGHERREEYRGDDRRHEYRGDDRRHEHRGDDRRHGKPHKRKSLLGEIFDF